MRRGERGLTLIEVTIAMSLFSMLLAAMLYITAGAGAWVAKGVDEARLKTEMGFALESVKLYCGKASQIGADTRFNPGGGVLPAFHFRRERLVRVPTPSVIGDDVWYWYYKNAAGDIVLKNEETQQEEVLIAAMFKPQISFISEPGFEPDFFTVTVTGESGKGAARKRVAKTAGVRLWYSSAVR
ncbi:MAG: prepilin-type N-terminal cleavage/methylation domain-containing protein [Elusimicrobia bacterium]|nr:prepilin-type N-terminal cleavage/methylation domain-containing protein [Elusimicrobiota bacterium]